MGQSTLTMAKFLLSSTGRFKKDLKLAKKRGLSLNDLTFITDLLEEDKPLPERCRNHQIHGQYEGCWECHINPDWLLIYIKDTEIRIISLQRTGTHSDLFGKNRK